MSAVRLTAAQARRTALVAQGFRDPRPAVPTMRTFARTLDRTGLLQVDSVNVLARAHYVPLYSRMGPYDPDLLHRAAERPPRRVVEYWAHVQALMPVELWPVMQHRMASYRARNGKWGNQGVTADLVDSLLGEIAERGASTARDLDRPTDGLPRSKDHWGWNWSVTRRALDAMFAGGQVAVAGRTGGFEIRYDLPERVLPADVLALPTPSPEEAHRELVRRAARSHGVATEPDLRDYYRMHHSESRPAVASLVDDGELVEAEVAGWDSPAYVHRDVLERGIPRRVDARALVSPFDPLVWRRERTERLFGFHYRIEIYVPAAQRRHGYYVLPYVLGDRPVARVDLKADRATGVLRVPAAYAEDHAPPETAHELAVELWQLAGWLGLDEVVVGERGDLAVALAVEVAGASSMDEACRRP